MGGPPKNRGVFTPQIIQLFIGFSIIFTIHFGVPLVLETSIYQQKLAIIFPSSKQDEET